MKKLTLLSTFVTFALGLVSLKLLNVIYQSQRDPYVDEIFHVKQAQSYCNNKWLEWDPKITTLPGLYLISLAFLKPLQLLGYENACSLFALRLTNVTATLLNFILSLQIIDSLERKHKSNCPTAFKILSALNIAIFPPLYFFTFLYYTDVWSTTFVLLIYNMHLSEKNRSKISVGLLSAMAVLMRQTNIIWVGLLLIDIAWKVIIKDFRSHSVQDIKSTQKIYQNLFSKILWSKNQKMKRLTNLISDLVIETYHLLFIMLLFMIFIAINGSIVLGDKAAHTPVFHLMQNFYFLNFAVFFAWSFALVEVASLWKRPPNIFLTIFLSGFCAAASEFNKVEHPYLLADNRHLAFYAWKRIFGHNLIRRFLAPVYVVSAILFYRMIEKRCHFMFVVALIVCIFVNLTPQHLFEFRYFIIPFLLWRLHFKVHWPVLVEFVFFAAVNSTLFYLFLKKPFTWASEPGAYQRFIW